MSIIIRIIFLCIGCIFLGVSCTTDKQNENEEYALINSYIAKAEDIAITSDQRKDILKNVFEEVKKLPNDSSKVNRIHELSYIYFNYENDHKTYKNLNDIALKISLEILDSLTIAKSYKNIGIYYRYKQLDSAYRNFYKADKIYLSFDKNGSINRKKYAFDHGAVLIDLAKLLRRVKDYSESEDLTIRSIKKFEFSGNLEYISLCYITLGIIAKYLERYEDAIKYNYESIKFAKNTPKDTFYTTSAYNNIGTIYKSKKEYKKAEEYYLKALSYKSFLKRIPKNHAQLLDNLGYVRFLSNKDDKSALDLFDKAYKIRDSTNDIHNISTSNLHYTEYYMTWGKDSIARDYALKIEEISSIVNDNDELLQAYQLLSKLSNNNKGLQYAQKYIKLNDSLIKEERLYRDKFARIRFETDEKEQQIIEVQNKNTIYLLGMLLLLTIISFTFFFFRQRTKYLAQQNKIVQFQASYDTETRISKRLHDELGNDIFQVMLQYQHNPQDPTIPEKLNTTYHKARDISRENSEFDTGGTYPKELTNMLQNYTQNEVQLILRGLDKMEWDNIGRNIKITVYRVLQELMTNMQKHSQATLVALVFNNTENQLTIKYSDNGVGMNQIDQKSSNGLRNTEKRIQAINGTIIFDSEKDKGFKAEIQIPN
ncbi:tetratricopeptide repeat-containing sensor histidine kinase [Aquimarina sp. MMG016]|uniref:tetratricopeptide repeat-containing sensor histidine kinase n=1 Tax=Aquimarina sp. MMG016 TaxID=2822690 RepID=UPI001B39DFFE|nr:tetratricopeptide repeat-containing sensor histidine kinase [Aquimarina sp. MMG016]MBQ4820732.1 tetratricopeptide repeat protein [Aquimarina sp. MMG016]